MSCCVTCECCRFGYGRVLVLSRDDTGSGAESRRGQQRQLFYDGAAARMMFWQLTEALLQRISQKVKLLTGLGKASLGLTKRGRRISNKEQKKS